MEWYTNRRRRLLLDIVIVIAVAFQGCQFSMEFCFFLSPLSFSLPKNSDKIQCYVKKKWARLTMIDTRRIHTFTQYFPFAGLETLFHWQDLTEFIKEVFHFFTSFTLSQLVTHAQLRWPGVHGLTCSSRPLLLLQLLRRWPHKNFLLLLLLLLLLLRWWRQWWPMERGDRVSTNGVGWRVVCPDVVIRSHSSRWWQNRSGEMRNGGQGISSPWGLETGCCC